MATLAIARAGLSQLVLPCTYARKKRAGEAEVGVAVHAGPEATSTFLLELTRAGASLGYPMYPVIGIDRRRRLQLEAIAFSFAAVGGELISLRRTADARDPVWGILRAAGVTEISHMPALPMEIPG